MMTIDELVSYTIINGLILLGLSVAGIIIQILINRCDRKEMENTNNDVYE